MIVTVYAYGRTQLLQGAPGRISRQLYLACPWWTHSACDELAVQLERGLVVTAPDFEAVLLPGDFRVLEARPAEQPGYELAVGA
jgi:hypothetical protein